VAKRCEGPAAKGDRRRSGGAERLDAAREGLTAGRDIMQMNPKIYKEKHRPQANQRAEQHQNARRDEK
jgi:hypothetical protein